MKKALLVSVLILIVWLYHLPADAPPLWKTYVLEEEVIHPFGITDYTLLSFMWYESRYNEKAENPVTKARGVLQILPVMVNEANRLRSLFGDSIRYTWQDAWTVDKSIEIWYLVQGYHNPEYDLQKACQIWFGRGIQYDGMTWREYYKDVQAYITVLSSGE